MLRVWEEEIKQQQRKRDTNKKSFYKEANTKMKSHIPLLKSQKTQVSLRLLWFVPQRFMCWRHGPQGNSNERWWGSLRGEPTGW